MDAESSGPSLDAAPQAHHISIKIKTTNGKVHALNVPKDILISTLKERLAGEVKISPELQRLISRGKVLKDDQLLSTYNVEDGHTLHLLTRLSGLPPSEEGQTSMAMDVNPMGQEGGLPGHGITVRAMSVPISGAGGLDLNRIVASVLSSINMGGIIAGGGGDGGRDGDENHRLGGIDVSNTNVEVRIDSVYSPLSGSGNATGASPGVVTSNMPAPSPRQAQARPSPIPDAGADAMSVMGEYIQRLETALRNSATDPASATEADPCESLNPVTAPSPPQSSGCTSSQTADAVPSAANSQGASPSTSAPGGGVSQQGRGRVAGPTQASLTDIGRLVRQAEALISGPVATIVGNYAQDLEGQASVTDAAARGRLQQRILQGGNQLQQLGSLLQELGCALYAVRYGVSPSEAHVRVTRPIFINQFGPNPLIVQPRMPAAGPSFPGLAPSTVHQPFQIQGTRPGQQQPVRGPTPPQPSPGSPAPGQDPQRQQSRQAQQSQPGEAGFHVPGVGPVSIRAMLASMDDQGNLQVMAEGVPAPLAAAVGESMSVGMPVTQPATGQGNRLQTGSSPGGSAPATVNGAATGGSSPGSGSPDRDSTQQARFPTPPLAQLHVQSWGSPSHQSGRGITLSFPMSGMGPLGQHVQGGRTQAQGQGLSLREGQASQGQAAAAAAAGAGAGARPVPLADFWSTLTQGLQVGQQPAQGAQAGGAGRAATQGEAQPGSPAPPDVGQLLGPLIRQLAGALGGSIQPRPPHPRAPPAGPPAPAEQHAPQRPGQEQLQSPVPGPQELPTPSSTNDHSADPQGADPGTAEGTVTAAKPESTSGPEIFTLDGTHAETRTGPSSEVEGGSAAVAEPGPTGASLANESDNLRSSGNDQLGRESSSGGQSAPSAPLGLGVGGLQPLARPRRRTAPRAAQSTPSQGGAQSGRQMSTSAPDGMAAMQQIFSQLSSAQPVPGGASGTAPGGNPMAPFMQLGSRLGPGASPQPGAASPLPLDQLLGSLAQGAGLGARGGGDPLAALLGGLGQRGSGPTRGTEAGLPPGLAATMGQMVQSPVLQNIVQQVSGREGVQGGTGGLESLDFGNMMAEMMPVVSQMLQGMGQRVPGASRDSAAGSQEAGQAADNEWRQTLNEENLTGWIQQIEEDERQQAAMGPQRPLSDAYLRGSPAKRQRTAMDGTAQRLQAGAPPEEVLRTAAEAAAEHMAQSRGAGGQTAVNGEELAQQIAATPGLPEAYVAMLWHDLGARLTADPDASDAQRFPNARAVLLSPPNSEPDGGDGQE